LRVAQDALLEYLPDPLIPFAGSRYQQQVSIEMAEGAGLFYWDMLAPGREAYGEVFTFERVGLALELCAGGEMVALERMELEPAMRPLTSPLRWGLFRYMATLYICRVGVPASQWVELENELATLVQSHADGQKIAPTAACPQGAVWGVSTLAAHGVVVRALGVNGRQLQAGLVSCWARAKERLYGRAAHLPRKLY
jgi:urease accessory protein